MPDPIERRRRAVVAMTADGMSAASIAAALGVSARTVGRHRAAAGVTQPPPVFRWTAENAAVAEALIEDGASATEVGRTIGAHRNTVRRRYPHAPWTPDQVGRHSAALRHTG